MGQTTKIEWTSTRNADGTTTPGSTWTPIRAKRRDTGKIGVHCERVSPACKNCYAATFNRRMLPSHGTGLDFTVLNRGKVEMFVDKDMLLAPIRWKKPRRIFVCSQTDLFGEFVTNEMIDQVFAVMALCPQHTFQVLTKRPATMSQYLTGVRMDFATAKAEIEMRWGRPARFFPLGFNYLPLNQQGRMPWPLPNVWLGVTAENQEWADKRIPLLLQTPAAKRFVSIEPMLGPVDLTRSKVFCQAKPVNFLGSYGCVSHADGHCLGSCPYRWPGIDWVICGGESGHGARPMHPDWASSLRDQCHEAGVAFFFKQWGEFGMTAEHGFGGNERRASHVFSHGDGTGTELIRVGKKAAGRLLDGREWDEFPAAEKGGER